MKAPSDEAEGTEAEGAQVGGEATELKNVTAQGTVPEPESPYSPRDAEVTAVAGDTSTIDFGIPDELLTDGASFEIVDGPSTGGILYLDRLGGRVLFRPCAEDESKTRYRVRLDGQWHEASLTIRLVPPTYAGNWLLKSVIFSGGENSYHKPEFLGISKQDDGRYLVPQVSVSCSFNAVWQTKSVGTGSTLSELWPDHSLSYSSETVVGDIRHVSSSPTSYNKRIAPSGIPGR